ncbi:hypothetical protein TrispH2_004202 [Trichoplax sp. H2]|nr:hypothetical protein TrispH2_004202 [Trichoplax sp. H2]|eukprot:RDD43960.1 hypothetical protein TrispH2_004202 [Trichoplax sp. H2]
MTGISSSKNAIDGEPDKFVESSNSAIKMQNRRNRITNLLSLRRKNSNKMDYSQNYSNQTIRDVVIKKEEKDLLPTSKDRNKSGRSNELLIASSISHELKAVNKANMPALESEKKLISQEIKSPFLPLQGCTSKNHQMREIFNQAGIQIGSQYSGKWSIIFI